MIPDCQLLILEKLNAHSLMMVAQTNQYYKSLALDVFKRMHAKKTITIWTSFLDDPINGVNESSDQISINNIEMAVMMLRTFGSVLQTLDVSVHSIEQNQRKWFHEKISKYCSDSLLSIRLNDIVEDELEEFPIPLRKVENVTLTNDLLVADGKFKITKVFPALRRLRMEFVKKFDGFIFYARIPTLEEVEITFPFTQGLETGMEMMFQKNPQIRILSIPYYNSLYCLESAHQYLKNLQELHITFNSQKSNYNEKLHFKTIKKLTATAGKHNFFKTITFEHLEELNLTCHSIECIDFVETNRNVSKLQINARSITDDQIRMMGNMLRNLTEISIKNEHEIKAITIIGLIEQATQLEKIKINFPGAYENLGHHLTARWAIRKDGEDIFIEKIKELK